MTASPDPTDLRGYRPETTGLTWKYLGKTLPIALAAYYVTIMALDLLFLVVHIPALAERFTFAIVLTAMSIAFLYPRFLKQMGSSRKKERREQVWASGPDQYKLAARQSVRYLLVAYPVELLAIIAGFFGASLTLRAFGL